MRRGELLLLVIILAEVIIFHAQVVAVNLRGQSPPMFQPRIFSFFESCILIDTSFNQRVFQPALWHECIGTIAGLPPEKQHYRFIWACLCV